MRDQFAELIGFVALRDNSDISIPNNFGPILFRCLRICNATAEAKAVSNDRGSRLLDSLLERKKKDKVPGRIVLQTRGAAKLIATDSDWRFVLVIQQR